MKLHFSYYYQVVAACLLIVALQLHGGRVSGSVGHTLVLINEDAVFLDGDLLLQGHSVILELLERRFSIL